MTIQTVILAAGQGKRMHSNLPKVLHRLAGKPLLQYVITTAFNVSPLKPVIVYGHQGEILPQAFSQQDINWVLQKEQLGTGHALLQAGSFIPEQSQVLILYGDVPLITEQTLKKLIQNTPHDAIGMLTAHLENPYGYGRIKRDKHQHVIGIVEEKDAAQDERDIREVNPGIYLIPARYLKKWLPLIENKNAQKEYYLTDIISFAVKENISIHTEEPALIEEILGVNDRMQLAHLERFYQRQQAEKLMDQGVTLRDPMRLDIRGDVHIGRDVIIDVNVILEGRVSIGDECRIGANTVLRDVTLGQRVEVKANCVIEEAEIADDCIIGPFARLRPGALLKEKVHIGNFVEVKKSEIATGSKVNHLSYIGDTTIGQHVNIGAGTITCNYDGANKHKTMIEDEAFIGSGTLLIAPVTIGAGATIGAGSTITHDAPPNHLTLARVAQHTVSGWQRKKK
jgi:bifunctional UDP-N-acetylglucosamine pyrophosphorylase/glucosamine-1-phosphate N-acetyltransferase